MGNAITDFNALFTQTHYTDSWQIAVFREDLRAQIAFIAVAEKGRILPPKVREFQKMVIPMEDDYNRFLPVVLSKFIEFTNKLPHLPKTKLEYLQLRHKDKIKRKTRYQKYLNGLCNE